MAASTTATELLGDRDRGWPRQGARRRGRLAAAVTTVICLAACGRSAALPPQRVPPPTRDGAAMVSHRVLPVPLPGPPSAAKTRPASPAACSFRLTVPGGETAILVYTTAAVCTTVARTLEPPIVGRTIAVTALVWYIPTVPPTCSSVSRDRTPLDVYPDGTHYVAALALCARLPAS